MFHRLGEIRPHLWRFLLAGSILAGAAIFLGLRFSWQLSLGLLLVGAFIAAWRGWSTAARLRAAYRQRDQQAQSESLAAQEALRAAQERLRQAELRQFEEGRRLQALMQLNRGLAEARDEQSLMDFALSTLTGLVGALGCSFVPVDEWEQPLPAFTYGQLPEPVLHAWATHLASHMLRERCGSCKLLIGPPGNCPLHPAEAGDTLRVFCIPLVRLSDPLASSNNSHNREIQSAANGKGPLGVLHLYMPPGRSIDASMRVLLDGAIQAIAMAYDSARLRSQELATLHQLQLMHAPDGDIASSLSGLLDGLRQALEADCVFIRLRSSPDERFSNLNIASGSTCGLTDKQIEEIFERLQVDLRQEVIASPPGEVPAWVSLPLSLPDNKSMQPESGNGHILGMLLAGCDHPHDFHPRQIAILQTVAAQAALLTENERMIRSLEYKVVIQERARLAREIHDGLAQTLAYLKLQAAQMQSYLAQGDTARLAQVLKENYQALTEAYLDTRQAIDNLRLTPNDRLETWLERILAEFENTSGLRAERRIQPLKHPVTPEVQAQLIRIVQEAFSNIRKHARAHQVWINLREWQNELVLEVVDDGLGFDAEDVPEISRHGLRGMRERAEMIGADFQIISQVRQGTTVRLVLPALEEETTQ